MFHKTVFSNNAAGIVHTKFIELTYFIIILYNASKNLARRIWEQKVAMKAKNTSEKQQKKVSLLKGKYKVLQKTSEELLRKYVEHQCIVGRSVESWRKALIFFFG